jgi:formylglycine-generating enzyme required for sulfatase activity
MQDNPTNYQGFLDFELEIGPAQGGGYPIAVLKSPAGEARTTVPFPFDELALERYLLRLENALLRRRGGRRQVLSEEEKLVQEFGRALFDFLLSGEARSRYDVSRIQAAGQGLGLRLKLRIQPPELAALPWEFLYDPRQAEYLCLAAVTPVVRYLELPQPVQQLTVEPPLRILGMLASPQGLQPLDIESEKERLERALAGLQAQGQVQLTWLEGRTWRDLQRTLRHGRWHIFHFIGHGGFDPQADEGLIVLENDDRSPHRLAATQLARLLADHQPLRLALLNACEGAHGGSQDIFSSTASILLRRGLPAVLAMQYPITDRAAIELTRSFYEALADGWPVDACIAEARKAISIALPGGLEWGTPVLHLRAPDGLLFRLQPPAATTQPPTTQIVTTVDSVQGGTVIGEIVAQPGSTVTVTASPPRQAPPAPKLPPELPSDLCAFVRIDREALAKHGLAAPQEIDLPFYIARYPLTNAQYARFVEAEDFADPRLWTGFPRFDEEGRRMEENWGNQGWLWLQNAQKNKKLSPDGKRVLPRYWEDPRFGAARGDAPVVGVTWFEANAYCRWLLRHWGELEEARQNQGWQPREVRLPRGAEWVLAAGGAGNNRYPWDPPGQITQAAGEIIRRANVDESKIGQTTPVGRYPLGKSWPFGLWDLAGNVWEWQANFYGSDHRSLSLRGGSWSYYLVSARAAGRYVSSPDDRWSDLGFRVSASPS